MSSRTKKTPLHKRYSVKQFMSDDKTVQEVPVIETKVETEVAPLVNTKVEDLYKKPEPKVVPEAKFLEYKKENKEIKKELAQLKQLVAEGATKKEVNDEIEALAKDHNVDTDFLRKLTSTIEKDLSKKFNKTETKESEDEEEIETKPNKDDFEKKFDSHFATIMENMPEFQGVVNKDVIKSLLKDPKNGTKTYGELIEETYGAVLKGKRTLDTAKTGKEVEPLDYKRATTDTDYRREVVFKDPTLRAQYNARKLRGD